MSNKLSERSTKSRRAAFVGFFQYQENCFLVGCIFLQTSINLNICMNSLTLSNKDLIKFRFIFLI